MLWTGTIIFGSLSALIILGEYVAVIAARRAGRNFSFVPLVPGLLGALACWICPIQAVRWFFWLPLLLDGSILSLLALPFYLITARWRRKPPGH